MSACGKLNATIIQLLAAVSICQQPVCIWIKRDLSHEEGGRLRERKLTEKPAYSGHHALSSGMQ